MVPDSFGNMTSDGRKKKLVTTVAGIATAVALLLGFVFTTVAANNSSGVAAAYAATQGNAAPQKKWLASNFRGTAPIEDPPYLVPFSQAAATVEKAFPDSKITTGERQYLTIKTKSSPPRLPSPGTGSGGNNDISSTTITPAYVFNLVKTDDKAMYQVTVVVNGTSGQIIPPKDIEEILFQPGIGIPYNPYECHLVKWGMYYVWVGPGCEYLHPPTD